MDPILYVFYEAWKRLSRFSDSLLNKIDKWDDGKVEQRLNMVRPLLIVLIFASAVIWTAKVAHTTYKLKNEGIYTTGTVEAYGKGARGNKAVIYSFYVAEKKYTGKSPYDARVNPKISQTYPVQYLPNNPAVNDMEFR